MGNKDSQSSKVQISIASNERRHLKFYPRLQGVLKKLVQLKTRQPMTLTDTPGTTFKKVSLDYGPASRNKNGDNYILTIQDLLIKYSLAIPLKQTITVHIADAFVSDFICTFGALRIMLKDQGSNFISLMWLHENLK